MMSLLGQWRQIRRQRWRHNQVTKSIHCRYGHIEREKVTIFKALSPWEVATMDGDIGATEHGWTRFRGGYGWGLVGRIGVHYVRARTASQLHRKWTRIGAKWPHYGDWNSEGLELQIVNNGDSWSWGRRWRFEEGGVRLEMVRVHLGLSVVSSPHCIILNVFGFGNFRLDADLPQQH